MSKRRWKIELTFEYDARETEEYVRQDVEMKMDCGEYLSNVEIISVTPSVIVEPEKEGE